MPDFSNRWFQNAIRYWEHLFDRLGWRDGRALTVIEIGSYEGQSTIWTIANLLKHPDSHIHCIDHFAGGIEHEPDIAKSLRGRFDANIAETGAGTKVHVHQGLSRDGLMTLRQQGVQADFIYVDGSHQGPDVLEDLILSFRLLKVGGLIICDDYLWFTERSEGRSGRPIDPIDSPKLAIDAFVNVFIRKVQLVQGQPLYQLAFRKIAD